MSRRAGARRWGQAATALLMGCVALIAAAGTAAAQGGTTGAPGGLRLGIDYVDGADGGIAFVVTNESDVPCPISRLADGAVTVAAVTVDGEPIVPELRGAYYHDGQAAARQATMVDLAPGDSLELAVSVPLPGPRASVASVSVAEEGPALVSVYPIDRPGEHAVTAVLVLPPAPSRPAACVSALRPARVEFTVVMPPVAEPSGNEGGGSGGIFGVPLALGAAIAAGAVGLAAAAVGGALMLRGRRGRGALLVLVVAGTATLTIGVTADVADAKVVVSPGAAQDFKSAAANCIQMFRDAGDPAGVLARAEAADKEIRIQETVFDSATTPDSLGDAANPNKRSASVINWNPTNRDVYSDGVVRDPCAVLYHELSHGADAATGTDNGAPCGTSGISVAEVTATFNENAYRAKKGLPPRKNYGKNKLPDSKDACKGAPKRPGRGPRRDCPAASCGSNNGDPHLRTFDQLRYDVQTVGEYVLVRAPGDDAPEVQVRHSAFGASRSVSVVSAAAVRTADGRVIEFGIGPGDRLAILVDGEPLAPTTTTGTAGIEIAATPLGDTAWVDAGGGTNVAVTALGGWGLDVEITPGATLRGVAGGLLGNFDGDPTVDLTDRAGKVTRVEPGALPDPEAVRTFSDTWRLTADESLFSYAAGESTETFTDLAFPEAEPQISPSARATAEEICAAQMERSSEEFVACVLDVAVTGLRVFAIAAAYRDATTADAASPPGTATSATATSTPGPELTTTTTTIVVAGTRSRLAPAGRLDFRGDLSVAGQVDEYEVDGDAGQVLFVQTEELGNECTASGFDHKIELIAPSGRSVLTGWDCSVDPGRRVLEESGTHRLQVSGDTEQTGSYRFALIGSGADQVFPLTFDQPMGADKPGPGAGTLERPGTEDRYRFTAAAGQVVFLQTEELSRCGAGFDLKVEVLAPSGAVVRTGWNCSNDLGRIELPEAGEYVVRVSGDEQRTGNYRFILFNSGPDQSFDISVGSVVQRGQPGPGAGEIERPGTADRYRLSVTAGQKAVLRPSPAGCTDRTAQRIEVLAPGGANVATTWTCFVDEYPLTFTESGIYTLVVVGDEQRTGSYRFELSAS